MLAISPRAVASHTAPIQAIPPEILGSIFKLASLQRWTAGPFKRRKRDVLTVVTISHVCRFWRNLSLALPALWSTIDDSNRQRLATFVDRSCGAPLRLQLRSRELLAGAESPVSLDRIHFLHIAPNSFGDQETLNLHLPNLECLLFAGSHGRGRKTMLFTQPAPSLRAMSLDYSDAFTITPTPRPAGLFPHLAHLHLYSNFGSYIVINDLLSMVVDLVGLRTLHLSATRVGWLPPSDPPTRAVAVPNLRRLWFSEWSLAPAFRLVSRLALGPAIKLGFGRCTISTHDIDHAGPPPDFSPLPGAIDTMALSLSKNTLRIVAQGPLSALWLDAKAVDSFEQVTLPRGDTEPRWANWALATILAPRAGGTTALRLHMCGAERSEQVAGTLRWMPELRALHLAGDGHVGPVLEALACGTQCPHLATLTVEFVGWWAMGARAGLKRLAALRDPPALRLRRVVLRADPANPRTDTTRCLRGCVEVLRPCVDEVEVVTGNEYRPSLLAVDRRWVEDEHGYWEVPRDGRPALDASWMRWSE